MAHSFCSDLADIESCSLDSNLSLSVGYFPCEDSFSYESTVSDEDTSSESSSVPFNPPIQGTWWTEGAGRLVGKRDQVQDSPEQFCKLSICLAWDIDVDAHHVDPIVHQDRITATQWVDKHPKRTQLTLSKLQSLVQKLDRSLENLNDDKDAASVFPEEDTQLPSNYPLEMSQSSHQEHNVDLSKINPSEKEEAMQLPQMSSQLQEHKHAERSSQATGNQRISTAESTLLSVDPLEREDAQDQAQARSCLNFMWVFRWLWQHVLSSCPGRGHPDQVPKSPHQLARKKRLFQRGKRIHPQESPELGQFVSPDF